jgi:small subunit ribosomal protein S20
MYGQPGQGQPGQGTTEEKKDEKKDDKKEAKKKLSLAYQAIDKAVKRGVMKKNTAARKKSKLSKMTK